METNLSRTVGYKSTNCDRLITKVFSKARQLYKKHRSGKSIDELERCEARSIAGELKTNVRELVLELAKVEPRGVGRPRTHEVVEQLILTPGDILAFVLGFLDAGKFVGSASEFIALAGRHGKFGADIAGQTRAEVAAALVQFAEEYPEHCRYSEQYGRKRFYIFQSPHPALE